MCEEIIVVTGLPRSGTSLMMQALQAGGIPVYTDGQRPADEHNPEGYLEAEQVKQLETDTEWVSEAKGQAVKVVSRWLRELPTRHTYRCLWMHRPIRDVLSSMQAMCGLPRTIGDSRLKWARVARGHKAFIRRANHMRMLTVGYDEMVDDPLNTLLRVAEYLEPPHFDVGEAAEVVDTDLRHHHTETA